MEVELALEVQPLQELQQVKFHRPSVLALEEHRTQHQLRELLVP